MVAFILEHLPFWREGEESFTDLLFDAAHWEFELFLILLIDLFIMGIGWGFVKRHIHQDVRQVREEVGVVDIIDDINDILLRLGTLEQEVKHHGLHRD
jgi:hypothetical protein